MAFFAACYILILVNDSDCLLHECFAIWTAWAYHHLVSCSLSNAESVVGIVVFTIIASSSVSQLYFAIIVGDYVMLTNLL